LSTVRGGITVEGLAMRFPALAPVVVHLRSHGRLFTVAIGVGALVGLSAALLAPRQYQSQVSFVAEQGGTSLDGLAGIASEFGVRLPSSREGYGPEFYRDLATSRPIAEVVLTREYESSFGVRGSLLELARIDGDSPAERIENGVRWLSEKAVAVQFKPQTGVLTLQVRTRWPDVSRQAAETLLESLQDFNLSKRQSRARFEKEFLEDRVDSARRELENSEGRLQSFLEKNRSYENAPMLLFAYERFQRDVVMRQGVYTSLVQAFEQARIEEVRATPVLTVLEPAHEAASSLSRGIMLKVAMGGLLGLLVGVALTHRRTLVTES